MDTGDGGEGALRELLELLDLSDTGARTHEDIFTGPSQWMPHGRIYGGQVLAQTVAAASRTVEEGRPIHSLHGYFLRPGDVNLPITFAVDRIHDGRSFSTRRTQAYQNGVPIFSMIASFQTIDDGFEHGLRMPDGIPEPESLPTIEELRAQRLPDFPRENDLPHPIDVRHVPLSAYGSKEPGGPPSQGVWMRVKGRLPDDPLLHRAVFAYASDLTLFDSVLRTHGVKWGTSNMRMASLDHAMWWHRQARADDWFLYVQESPNAGGGRSLGTGRLYTREGSLIASIAQESMIRVFDA